MNNKWVQQMSIRPIFLYGLIVAMVLSMFIIVKEKIYTITEIEENKTVVQENEYGKQSVAGVASRDFLFHLQEEANEVGIEIAQYQVVEQELGAYNVALNGTLESLVELLQWIELHEGSDGIENLLLEQIEGEKESNYSCSFCVFIKG